MTKSSVIMLGSGLLSFAAAQAQSERPNVIMIVADDLGYGDLSCYGATRVSTPNVDSVANAGVRFTDAHAVASTSTPSRYSLLTGEYCFRRPGTDIATGDAGMIIRPEQYTLADMFRSKGYHTAAIGKWHLGLGSETGKQNWNKKLDMGLDSIGFDYYYIMAATADRVPCVYIENGEVVNYDESAPISVSYNTNFAGEPTGANNPELLTKLKSSHGHNQAIVNGIGRIGYMKGGGKALWRDEDIADSIIVSATRFMEQKKDEPFFMYLCTNDVHVPRMPNERFRGKSVMGLRGEAILQFDYTIGKITQKLKELGIADNTLLIITSDNGPVLDDGYQDQAAELAGSHKPGGPWRGGKYSAFEAGTAVPFIVSWAGHTPKGKVSDALVSHIDYMASLGALIDARLPLNAGVDSQDHLSTWLGQDDDSRAYVAAMAQNRTLTLRTHQFKYIEPSNGGALQGDTKIETGYNAKPQLYNIANSKDETTNVYASRPAEAKQLSTLLAELRQPYASGDTCFWYQLVTPNRESRYATSTGVGKGIVGKAQKDGNASEWKFVKRTDGETYDIVNRKDGSYIVPGEVKKPALQLLTSATPPTSGWQFKTNGIMRCLYAVTNGTSQMNQAEKSRNFMVLNWGNGTNTTDAGCLYAAMLCDATTNVSTGIETPEINADNLRITNGKVYINGMEEPAKLYDISGKMLPQNTLPQHTGIYIAKVGGKTFKIVK